MRLLILSDVHSNLSALEAVLEDAGQWDAAISAGDVVGYGPNPEECVETLMFKGFRCARGNHDSAVCDGDSSWFNDDAQDAININRGQLSTRSMRWLGSQPTELRLKLQGLDIAVYHGSPTEPLTSYIYPQDANARGDSLLEHTGADVIILGHTHIPYIVERKGKFIINPGSVGQPRDGDARASYLVLETDRLTAELRRSEYSIDATAEAIDAAGLPHRFATRLYRGI